MDKEKYKNIDGIETFWYYFPDKPWHYFHNVLEFRWYQEFDPVEWCNRTYLDLKMTDIKIQDTVIFQFIDVSSATCEFNGWISGFDIVNLRHGKTWIEPQYEILDFEDSSIHFYCKDIKIKVIIVNGKEIEISAKTMKKSL